MQKKTFYILPLFLLSAILRFWKLGEIPKGLDLKEVEFGLSLTEFSGGWLLNPLFVRLPFAILGVLSIFMAFLLIKRLSGDFWTAYLASFILAASPWHITQSRVYSIGVLIFAAVLFILLLPRPIGLTSPRIAKISVGVAILIFAFSIFAKTDELRLKVDYQRNVSARSEIDFPERVFANKVVESYRYRENLVFENLDFGNYFFSGHPRERWGVEEVPKFYITTIPLFLLGFVNLKKRIGWFLIGWTSLSLALLALFGGRGPEFSLTLALPVSVLIALGINFLLKPGWKKNGLYVLSLVAIFEFVIFAKSYFAGFGQSLFSPRRAIYQDLVPKVQSFRAEGERVLVSERLGEPFLFFQFYLKNSPRDFEFREFDIWREKDFDKIFVDVLPDDPSPKEPLYKENDQWPEQIKVLAEFYDRGKRQTVVVFRYQ